LSDTSEERSRREETMKLGGYANKIARINLTDGQVRYEEIKEDPYPRTIFYALWWALSQAPKRR